MARCTHALRMPAEVLAIAEANGWPLAISISSPWRRGRDRLPGCASASRRFRDWHSSHGRRVVAVPASTRSRTRRPRARRPARDRRVDGCASRRCFRALYRTEPSRDAGLPRLIGIEGADGRTAGGDARAVARPRRVARDRRRATAPAMYPSDNRGGCAGCPSSMSPACVAGVIGRLAFARASEASDPASVRPLYVRRPAVELARDEKLRRRRSSATMDTRSSEWVPWSSSPYQR